MTVKKVEHQGVFRVLGWNKDKADERDKKYLPKVIKAEELPAKVDFRDKLSPVEDQGELGSCTANSAVGCLEYLDKKDDGKYVDLSRLFIYYNTRVLEGTPLIDSGATIRDTVKSMVKFGVCPENGYRGWNYNIKKFAIPPYPWCFWLARKALLKEYQRIPDGSLFSMKDAISHGTPFMFGFMVFESFMSSQLLARTGRMPMPKGGEAILGGHAVCAVGYDDAEACFIIRNSWGENWGEKGYFHMPYDFIKNPEWCSDFWTIIR